MFYSITGEVLRCDEQMVAVSCSGVGFRCLVSRKTSYDVANGGTTVTLYTYLSVKEDALDLYGFSTEDELEIFKTLITVSGVGPKVALSILSDLTPDQIILAISSGDAKAITAANGVGSRLAQRIILELKEKIGSFAFSADYSGSIEAVKNVSGKANTSEAVSALVSLGYSQSEASAAVGKLDPSLSVEELIKAALKSMTLRF